jgi:hypothetical protein
MALGGAEDLPPIKIESSPLENAKIIAFALALAAAQQDEGK